MLIPTTCTFPIVVFALNAAVSQSAPPPVDTTRSPVAQLHAPDAEDGFVFIVYGDRTGGPDEGIAILSEAVRETNLLDPDLVMTVGDLVNGYNDQAPWLKQMLQFKAVMGGLDCSWYPVAGNHDVYWRGPNRPDNEHESNYETHFGPLWYDFAHKDSHFIVLYTDEPNPATGERNYTKAECQVMSDLQLAFLDSALERGKDADHVFVFLHHPRWLGGRYGDDWERVHKVLANAGNVSACFAGHIHQMRYDGKRDGIEYVTLATVGGHQNSFAPEGGWLHQFHVVTVRDDSIELAAVPVGELLDVRDVTGSVSQDTRALAQLKPVFNADSPIEINADGSAADDIVVTLKNPTARSVLVTMTPSSPDARWTFTPPAHQQLGPGVTGVFKFNATRSASPIDEALHAPQVSVTITYATNRLSYDIPPHTFTAPIHMAQPKEE